MFTNHRRGEVERAIVSATIKAAIDHGFKLDGVNNGEDDVKSSNRAVVMEHAFACDQAHIFFTHPDHGDRSSWLFIVLGNEGWTVISDYTMDLDAAVTSTDALVEKFEEEWARG